MAKIDLEPGCVRWKMEPEERAMFLAACSKPEWPDLYEVLSSKLIFQTERERVQRERE